jgi:hypothetical protein
VLKCVAFRKLSFVFLWMQVKIWFQNHRYKLKKSRLDVNAFGSTTSMFDFGGSSDIPHPSSSPSSSTLAPSSSLFNFSPRRVAIPVLVRDGIPCDSNTQNPQHHDTRSNYNHRPPIYNHYPFTHTSALDVQHRLNHHQSHPAGGATSGGETRHHSAYPPTSAVPLLPVSYSASVPSVYPAALNSAVAGRYSNHLPPYQSTANRSSGLDHCTSGFTAVVPTSVGGIGAMRYQPGGGFGSVRNAPLQPYPGEFVLEKPAVVGLGPGSDHNSASTSLTAAAAAAAICGELNWMSGPPRWW